MRVGRSFRARANFGPSHLRPKRLARSHPCRLRALCRGNLLADLNDLVELILDEEQHGVIVREDHVARRKLAVAIVDPRYSRFRAARPDRRRRRGAARAVLFGAEREGANIEDDRSGLLVGPDGVTRCWWAGTDPLYVAYHDREWGRPLYGDDPLFEMLSLEAFQAGLAWITILRKREAFRQAFAGFRVESVARFGESDVARVIADAGIVRNRAKIEATIGNARAALALMDEGDRSGSEDSRLLRGGRFTNFLWSFAPPARPARVSSLADLPSVTPEAVALSKALKGRGFRFVGPTIVYAFMEAVGMVDDHLAGCDVEVVPRG